jgi:hypothetical protein
MKRSSIFLLSVFLLSAFSFAQTKDTSPEKVPVMDGGAGPCSLDLTVTNADAKRIYAATVKVHISYGFAGIRRLDLEAGTNSEGKVRFTGLPRSVHKGPLEFHVSKDDLQGMATYDPAAECEAKRTIALSKSKANQSP